MLEHRILKLNKKIAASFLLVFPTIVLISDAIFELISKDIRVVWILGIVCICSALFHIVWTWYIAVRRDMSVEPVMFSTIGKLMFVPIYLLIIAYGLGLKSAGGVFDLLNISEAQRMATPLLTAIMLSVIFFIMTFSQFVGLVRMYDHDELKLFEAVIFITLSWVYIADICIGVAAYIKHKHYIRSGSSSPISY